MSELSPNILRINGCYVQLPPDLDISMPHQEMWERYLKPALIALQEHRKNLV